MNKLRMFISLFATKDFKNAMTINDNNVLNKHNDKNILNKHESKNLNFIVYSEKQNCDAK